MIKRKVFYVFLISPLCLIFILLNFSGTVSALEIATEDIDENLKNKFLSNIAIQLVEDDKNIKSLSCFDISKDGLIMLCSEDSTKKYICVYNNDMSFKYGYTFTSSGKVGCEFNYNGDVVIYFIRSDIAIVFDKKANCIDMHNIPATSDNNDYLNREVFVKNRAFQDKEYELTNDGIFKILSPYYTKLVSKNSDNEVFVIFEVSKTETIIKILFISFLILALLIIILWNIKSRKK